MALYLLNTIGVGTQIHYSGSVIPAELVLGVRGAGGQLVDSASFPGIVATAALANAERREGRGANAERIMAANASAYIAGSVQSVSAAFTAASAVAAGAVTTLDAQLSAALPTGARFMGLSLEGETGFDDATHAAFAVTVGNAAGGAQFGASTSVNAAATGYPKSPTLGSAAYLGAPIGGMLVTARLTGGVNLSTVTAGALTVKLLYVISP